MTLEEFHILLPRNGRFALRHSCAQAYVRTLTPCLFRRTQSKLVLEGDQRCFERDVRWEEMVHVDQGAAAGLFGALHRVQKLS
ncbi:unnamed protein product, partial [Ectocarpus fasciculatus]